MVQVDKIPDFTGVIYVPSGIEEDKVNSKGTVVAVGPGKCHPKTGDLILMDERLVPGARVIFGKFAGTEVGIEGEDHRILPDSDILMIFDPDGDSEDKDFDSSEEDPIFAESENG